MVRLCLVIGFLLIVSVAGPSPSRCDPLPAINLNFPASDGMTVMDCLRVVSMETGEVLLPDSSVLGSVGAIHITKTSIPDILTALQAYEPGLVWQTIYYPAGSNEPSGDDIENAIHDLQTLDLDGIVVPPSGDDKIMLSFKKQYYASADQEKQTEAGFRAYYLISDPTMRGQVAKTTKSGGAPVPLDPPTQFLASLNDISNQIAKMTPQQQVAAINEMANKSRLILQSISPQAVTTLYSQSVAQRNAINELTAPTVKR